MDIFSRNYVYGYFFQKWLSQIFQKCSRWGLIKDFIFSSNDSIPLSDEFGDKSWSFDTLAIFFSPPSPANLEKIGKGLWKLTTYRIPFELTAPGKLPLLDFQLHLSPSYSVLVGIFMNPWWQIMNFKNIQIQQKSMNQYSLINKINKNFNRK